MLCMCTSHKYISSTPTACTNLDDSGKLVSESPCVVLQPSSTLPTSLVSPGASQQNSEQLAITVGSVFSVFTAVAVLLLVVIGAGVVLWLLIKKRGVKRKKTEHEPWYSSMR